jgi:hypothetical protein
MIIVSSSAPAVIEESHKKRTKNTSHLRAWSTSRLESTEDSAVSTFGTATATTVPMIIVSVSS